MTSLVCKIYRKSQTLESRSPFVIHHTRQWKSDNLFSQLPATLGWQLSCKTTLEESQQGGILTSHFTHF